MPEKHRSQVNRQVDLPGVLPYFKDPVLVDTYTRVFRQAGKTTQAGSGVFFTQLRDFNTVSLLLQNPEDSGFQISGQPRIRVLFQYQNSIHKRPSSMVYQLDVNTSKRNKKSQMPDYKPESRFRRIERHRRTGKAGEI